MIGKKHGTMAVGCTECGDRRQDAVAVVPVVVVGDGVEGVQTSRASLEG